MYLFVLSAESKTNPMGVGALSWEELNLSINRSCGGRLSRSSWFRRGVMSCSCLLEVWTESAKRSATLFFTSLLSLLAHLPVKRIYVIPNPIWHVGLFLWTKIKPLQTLRRKKKGNNKRRKRRFIFICSSCLSLTVWKGPLFYAEKALYAP